MRLLRLLPLAVLILVPVSVRAQPAAAAAPTTAPLAINSDVIQRMSLRDAPLDLVLGQLEAWTGRIVLRPQALPAAAITLNITHQVTKAEASAALESVLEMNGIGVVYMGEKFIKIVDLAATRPETPELLAGKAALLPASNKVMSKIFELTYLQAANIVPQLNTMLTPRLGGAIFFNNSGSFLVTDTIANLQRVELLVDQLDHPALPHFAPHFFQQKFANAADVATSIQAIVQGPLQNQIGAANITLSADVRTNQLIVLGDERQLPLFKQLIDSLDIKADPVTVNKVIPIKHGDATKIDPMLRTMISGQTASIAAASNTRGGATNGSLRTTMPSQAAPQPTAQPGGQPGAAPAAAPANINVTPGGGSSSTADFSPYLAFTNDPRSNSIVATGTPDDMRILEDLIKGIDVVLPEVRIEVVIADVNLTDDDTTGIQTLGLQVQNNKLIGFNSVLPGLAISGLTSNTTTSTFASITRHPLDLSGILNLSTTPLKNHATILSAPSIVTSHNTQGMIFVGEQRPVISGSVNSGTTGGTTTTITQLDIGIQLTVTPLIGTDGSVYLNIATQVNGHSGDITIDGNPQPIISRRQTQSYIGCMSGDILVLGGLQGKSENKTTSRLGPIPYIGDLLGGRTSEVTRSDLIFFIRPTVITGKESDNEKIMQHVDGMIQGPEIKDMLGIPPPAAPAAVAPAPAAAAPAASNSPALRRQR